MDLRHISDILKFYLEIDRHDNKLSTEAVKSANEFIEMVDNVYEAGYNDN